MLEITPADIAPLSDENLRALVGLLCESEMRDHNFATSCVTWGGHQNAGDGGLDVRVALPANTAIDGFVPRPATGFQVKRMDMPANRILMEMSPSGVLRPVIRDLANRSGAYIIVSSSDSTSDKQLQKRRDAMAEAVKDLPNASALKLDFYDRTRLATWVRDHPGLILWVREIVGKALPGWQSYAAWAYSPGGVNDEYLLDDKLRIRTDTEVTEGGFSALEGLRRIRDRLHDPRRVVRLIGLSGVGKTRLVQALFDARIGDNSLDRSLAAYTNMADAPDPPPTTVVSGLIAARQRAILVIDNCQPELHRRLSELCRSPESLVSVITVEYDIREDQPEGTDVFSLEPSSIDLIEKLVKHRFQGISPVDARTVAEFADGNARIAVALADTIAKNESIAGLSDEDLFKRLFQQRHEPSESLLLAAQVLSLVYSFQGEDVSAADQSELFRLGALIGKTPQEMFGSVAELKLRNLVQRRGVWRAVLPQAIANRLAVTALQKIPLSMIEAHLINGAPERLFRSFSRRVGYLNTSPEARKIAMKWLSPEGLLADLADLNDLGDAILNNIAPLAPRDVLVALERVLLEPKDGDVVTKCRRHVQLLRSLAYDPAIFERCIKLLVKIAAASDVNNDEREAQVLASLFPLYFSGTHASIKHRLAVINSLLCSREPKESALGVMALRTSLEAIHFSPGFNFEFGALSRDYGYWPRTIDDVKLWFAESLKFAETLACSDEPIASQVRAVIAEKFRGLWISAASYDDLERICRAISDKHFWTDGWIAVRQTLHYDSKGFSPEILVRLKALEALLRPRDLVQKVRSMVLSEAMIYVGLDSTDADANDIGKAVTQIEVTARDLGRTTALAQDAFTELLPELISGKSQQLWSFGGGLAEGGEEPRAIWTQLVAYLAVTPIEKRSPQVFCGFLNGLHTTNPKLTNTLLDHALEDETLSQWFPVLQTAVGIDKEGVNRLMRSLDLGKAWIGIYRNLVMGGVTHQISGSDFNMLLLRIAGVPGGLDIALEILCMRLSFEEGRRQSSPSEIVDVGCELMRQIKFTARTNDVAIVRLGMIARHCLVGEKGAATVGEICRNLKAAVSKTETNASYHGDLLRILLEAYPFAALESLCGGDTEDFNPGISILDQAGQFNRNPFDKIPESDLLIWCDQQPQVRYPVIAAGVTAFRWTGEPERPQLTSTARKVLDNAPDRVAVLKKLLRRASSTGWMGSQIVTVASHAKLLDELESYPDSDVVQFVATEKIRLARAIEVGRDLETRIQIDRDERFE